MLAIIFILSIFAQVSQQMFRKEYNKRNSDDALWFSLCGVLATLIYFLILSGGKFNFSPDMLIYIIPFSLCYTAAYICTMYAIKHGPLSLTSLMISCSTAVPLIHGVAVLKEPLTVALALGVIFLFACILLVSEPWKKEDNQITLKWIIYISITFLTNGICMTSQKLFQVSSSGGNINEFMICSLALTFLSMLVFVLIKDRQGIKPFIKKRGLIWPVLCGTGNGVANQLTMMLAVTLPASFLYPVQSAGSILLTAIVSILIYKEKLSNPQKVGFVFGVLAIIIFNM